MGYWNDDSHDSEWVSSLEPLDRKMGWGSKKARPKRAWSSDSPDLDNTHYGIGKPIKLTPRKPYKRVSIPNMNKLSTKRLWAIAKSKKVTFKQAKFARKLATRRKN